MTPTNPASTNPASESDRYTTTDAGIAAATDDHSLTVGPDGPILLQDHYLIQKMAHFNRERVPERVVHAKGGGAFGYFEVDRGRQPVHARPTLFAKGRGPPMLVRFSTVAGELGSRRHRARPARLRHQVLHRGRATTTWSATTRRSSSSGTRRSSRTSSTRRSAAPTTACATTTCSGTSGRSRRSRPTR